MGLPVATAYSSSSTVRAVRGGRSHNTSYNVAPSEYTSAGAPASSDRPWACSGARYAGVPVTAPARVVRGPATSASSPSTTAGARSTSTRARPQSITNTSPNGPNITLGGLRSRWTTPRAWA
jgi:hypothetical protein